MKTICSTISLILFSIILLAQQSGTPLMASSERVSLTDTDENGITVETRIVIEKDKDDRAKIVFWQETNNGFFFKNVNWTGTVRLKLDNGETIELIDRNMKGHEMQKGGHIAGYFVPDLYQRYSAYYLTDKECNSLKEHKLVKVEYRLDDEYETATKYLDLSSEQYFIKDQLTAIGK